ncbi:hypothetical protein MMC29_001254 [Sticta canariensis]|nr:hypothetical protein [Sticta canariensis]
MSTIQQNRRNEIPSGQQINVSQELKTPRRRMIWRKYRIASHQVLCLLWLGPALALLVLNFSGYVVGASIGLHPCRINVFSSRTFEEVAICNKASHTAMGWLQFASKALEIWFMVVISGILYDVLKLLSSLENHFPVGFLAKYVEFGDPLSLARWPKGTKKLKHHAFIALVAVLCILVNLMAPATAILILPSLQWIEKAPRMLGVFGSMAARDSPHNPDVAINCNATMLSIGNFSCTKVPYAHILDQLFASVASSLGQIGASDIIFDPIISQEQQVSLIVNTTDADVDWIPVRQVGREISDDYLRYADAVRQEPQPANYSSLTSSLNTILVRKGPTIGLAGGAYRGNLSVGIVGEEKTVRCYGGWDLYADEGTEFTRCIRVGNGWTGTTNIHSRFYLGDTDSTRNVTVDVYFADRVHTLSQPNNPPCFINGNPQANSSCNWDQVFVADSPSELLQNTSVNIILIEYTVPELSTQSRTVWCDDIVYVSFDSYSMDPSPFSNFIHLTLLENADPRVAPGTIPLTVHSDWILAGWSVNNNGTVDGTRIAARTMIQLLKQALSDDADHLNLTTLSFMDGVAADLGLSMIGYNITSDDDDPNHPALTTSVKLYVWAYGLQSRTSVLGVVVLLVGILCVLLRVLMAMLGQGGYTSPRSLARLLVAALEHDSRPEGGNNDREGGPETNKAMDEAAVMVKVQGRRVSFLTTG